MNIETAVRKKIVEDFDPGKLFEYSELPRYSDSPASVARAVSKLAKEDLIKRFSKGLYYIPQQGVLGEMGPRDSELLRVILEQKGRRSGYITGPALYNRLGLSSQIPKTIIVAINGSRQEKDFGTIRIKLVRSRAPIEAKTIPLLEFLDVLRDVKKIPDAEPNSVLKIISGKIAELTERRVKDLQRLAIKYYNAAVRALVGLVIDRNEQLVVAKLPSSLNPLTRFLIGLDGTIWPDKAAWYIR